MYQIRRKNHEFIEICTGCLKKTGISGFAFKSIKKAPNWTCNSIFEISKTSAIQKWYHLPKLMDSKVIKWTKTSYKMKGKNAAFVEITKIWPSMNNPSIFYCQCQCLIVTIFLPGGSHMLSKYSVYIFLLIWTRKHHWPLHPLQMPK